MQIPDQLVPGVGQDALPGRGVPRVSDDASPAAFGAAIGGALEQAGREQGAVESEQYRLEMRAKQQADQERVIDANTQKKALLDQQLYDPKNGVLAQQGANAVNLPARYLPGLQKQIDAINAGLTPDQARMSRHFDGQIYNEFNSQTNRHEYQQSQVTAENTFKSAVNGIAQSASLGYMDKAKLADERSNMTMVMNAAADRHGITDPAQRAEYLRQGFAEMHGQVIDRMLADNRPGQAWQYFKRSEGELDGKEAAHFSTAIQAALHKNDAQDQAAYSSAWRDYITAVDHGIQGAKPPPKAAAVAAGIDPKEYDKQVNQVQTYGNGKALASWMSRDQFNAHVDAVAPLPTSQEGSAEAYDNRKQLITGGYAVIKERESDPARFLINQGVFGDLSQMKDQERAQELTRRVAAIPGLAQKFGHPVPLLSKNEAGTMVESLSAQGAQDKGKSLVGLYSAMSNDAAWAALTHQIAPKDPVMAIAASKLAYTNPNKERPVWYDPKAEQDPSAVGTILRGEEILNPAKQLKDGEPTRASKGFPMPKNADLDRAFYQHFNENSFTGRSQTLDAAKDAFRSGYAALAEQKGRYDGEFDSKIADQAAKLVHPNVDSTYHVPVPNGMDPGKFPSWAEAAAHRQLSDAGYSKGDIDNFGKLGMYEIGGLGSGRYRLVNGNGPMNRKDGSPITFDIRNQYLASRGVAAQ